MHYGAVALWLAGCLAAAGAHVAHHMSPEADSDFSDIMLCEERAGQMEDRATSEQHKAQGCNTDLGQKSAKLLKAQSRVSFATSSRINATREQSRAMSSTADAVALASQRKADRENAAANCSSHISILESTADSLHQQATFQDESHASELAALSDNLGIQTREQKLNIETTASNAKEQKLENLRAETSQMVETVRNETRAKILELKLKENKVLMEKAGELHTDESNLANTAAATEHHAEAERLAKVEHAVEEKDAALLKLPGLEQELQGLHDDIQRENNAAAEATATHSKLKAWAATQLANVKKAENNMNEAANDAASATSDAAASAKTANDAVSVTVGHDDTVNQVLVQSLGRVTSKS